jgi:hypothetical protein
MGHFGKIFPNNIYNKYVLVAAQLDQASHSYRVSGNWYYNIVPLPDILPLHQIYMISVNLENNDDRKMSSRKRLETTLYLRTLTVSISFLRYRDSRTAAGTSFTNQHQNFYQSVSRSRNSKVLFYSHHNIKLTLHDSGTKRKVALDADVEHNCASYFYTFLK